MANNFRDIKSSLERLNAAAAAVDRKLTYMEICGTHTTSAFRSGLHSLMPDNVTLLSGPGCPVCVTAQGEIDLLIELAIEHEVILYTYGDMLRVPGACGSLEAARSSGADVRIAYGALDPVKLAENNPEREVVFAAVGFETTTPATAAAVLEAEKRGLTNFSVLASHKLVIPAIRALLDGGGIKLDGLLCPGHVSVIIGSDAYQPIVDEYGQSCVIAGFEPPQMAAALASLTELSRDGKPKLVNCYPEAVTAKGNQVAWQLIQKVFEPADVVWRGVGVIPLSGLALRREYDAYNAIPRFGLRVEDRPEPRGCRCGDVITARCVPTDCKLFGTGCTPINPIGPCMVSGEGTCQAWFKYQRKQQTLRQASGVTT